MAGNRPKLSLTLKAGSELHPTRPCEGHRVGSGWPFCSYRAHSVPDRPAAIRRYKLGLVPSDIRSYLRFDTRCWPIGPEKREIPSRRGSCWKAK
jgi:hypothetical protein